MSESRFGLRTGGVWDGGNHTVAQSGISIATFYEPVAPLASALVSRSEMDTGRSGKFFAPAQSPETVEVVCSGSLEMPEVKSPLKIDPDMTVDEIMRRWPATIRVFIRNRMLCIGCPIGVFHTVKDACNAHDLVEESFLQELLAAMTNDDLVSGPSVFEIAVATDGAGDRERATVAAAVT